MSSKFLFLLILPFCLSASAQNPSAAALEKTQTRAYRDKDQNTDLTLSGQYKFMLSRTRTSADGYKLVNPNRLTTLWNNVEDSLKKERADKKALNRKIADHEKTIGYLKTEMAGKEASLSDRKDQINEISFLGMSFNKGTYSLIVWSIIGVLTAALAFVISKSASKIAEAKHRTELYDEIAGEYQNYKAKAVEKERKLARELQDERNKIDEMKNGRN
jgi:hypothetical protein